ncbi:hypothetical protein GIY56_13225 [Paracoccus sp. YIM 132242]|uniref:Uncharacterized protein n=1 Tax=Paracoccus lichenicola TaxID=2665644 RepID=A0A6L6HT21_9RHOB|nr:hypothetical protein [Paracoccus lichenicola]MTE01245.1 hypothetical protein [Paracoccus lichenicola]
MSRANSAIKILACIAVACFTVACAAPSSDTVPEDNTYHENFSDNCPIKDELSKSPLVLKKIGSAPDGRTNFSASFGSNCSYELTARNALADPIDTYITRWIDADGLSGYPKSGDLRNQYIEAPENFKEKKLFVLQALGTGPNGKDSRAAIFIGNSLSTNDVDLGE